MFKSFALNQEYHLCGPWTSSISSIWVLERQILEPHPNPTGSDTLGWARYRMLAKLPSISVFSVTPWTLTLYTGNVSLSSTLQTKSFLINSKFNISSLKLYLWAEYQLLFPFIHNILNYLSKTHASTASPAANLQQLNYSCKRDS